MPHRPGVRNIRRRVIHNRYSYIPICWFSAIAANPANALIQGKTSLDEMVAKAVTHNTVFSFTPAAVSPRMIALTTSGCVENFTPPMGFILMPTLSSGVKNVRHASATVFFAGKRKHPLIHHSLDNFRFRFSIAHNHATFDSNCPAFFIGGSLCI